IGYRKNDPVRYSEAANVLGGPSVLVVVAQVAVTGFSTLLGDKASPAQAASELPTEADYQRMLDDFFRSDRVPEAIKNEVRAACSKDAAKPSETHGCAQSALAQWHARAYE